MNRLRHLGTTILIAALLAAAGAAQAAVKAGHVLFARGAVSAEAPDQTVRLLGRRSPLYAGDIITTGPKSYAVVKFEDGGRLSLRPDTVFTVKEFSRKKTASRMIMNLFKGGLRMISGLISKRNPNGVRLSASGVTIGIRGTELDARICKGDCDGKGQTGEVSRARVIGRVALMRGSLSATDRDQNKRRMVRGAPLYEGDTLETGRGSWAVLAMRDRGRFTLKPETEFRVDMHRYSPKKEARPSLFGSAFSLLKGGVRVLTGLIGKRNPRAFSIRTTQATIGIRGSGFDLDDRGPCGGGAGNCGLFLGVWKGGATARTDKGFWVIDKGQNGRIEGRDAVLAFIKIAPRFDVPRPDKVQIDFEKLFAALKEGLIANCKDGHCTATLKDGEEVSLEGGESITIASDGQEYTKSEFLLDILEKDVYLQTINQNVMILNEISGPPVIIRKDIMCTVSG